MNKNIRFLLFIGLIASILFVFTECNSVNSTKITIFTGFNSSFGNQQKIPEIPTAINKIIFSVTGEGISIPEQILTPSQTEITLNVDAGRNRKFELKAFNSTNELLYTGSTTVDLQPGERTTITITMQAITGTDSHSIGDIKIYTTGTGSPEFKTTYITGITTTPTKEDDSGVATINNSYEIAETEVTYELWDTVYQWAISHGYTFANAGRQGGNDSAGPVGTEQNPVTNISWRDAMLWTNALTEYYNAKNGTHLECAYYSDSKYTTPIKTVSIDENINGESPGSEDCPFIKYSSEGNTNCENCTATGFRLPTLAEWSIASRYIEDSNKNGILDINEYTPGNYASGATGAAAGVHQDIEATDFVAIYNTSSTSEVKRKFANWLQLYDMSGNVSEWNFNWHPNQEMSNRLIRGGAWNDLATGIQLGLWTYSPPYSISNDIGFRIAKSH